MENLPDEIWMEIILKLNINNMLSINILSKKFHQIIKSYKINDISKSHVIKLSNTDDINDIIKILINEYNFKKYDLSFCKKLTNKSVKMLTNLNTLYLMGCNQITDDRRVT